uniref:Reverse transcriptase domain-containing protein n=1 Tax=Kryptolebias marmoratus TaxID=37003 RepID=A0A3Q3FPX7_KRYMA
AEVRTSRQELSSLPVLLRTTVCQGDPLSPLLFNLAMKHLAIGIREHPEIKGIRVGGIEIFVTSHANDLLICLDELQISIPALLDYVDLLGSLSGYRINWGKCEFMPLVNTLNTLPFTVTNHHFSYLVLTVGGWFAYQNSITIQLHKPVRRRGLGLQVLKHYHWAANMRALTYWNQGNLFDPALGDLPIWPQTEASFNMNISLSALLFSGPLLGDKQINSTFTIKKNL